MKMGCLFKATRRRFIASAAVALAAPALLGGRANAVELAAAETQNGVLHGLRDHDGVRFRGVQYAADTSGANRFMAPQPVQSWTGPKPAFQDGDRSPQAPETFGGQDWFAWYAQGSDTSENCCVLNVFTPDLDPSARRPVMVYLHGGGFRSGGGGGPGLDGINLANFGDVVVVAINHRLNVLGYLHLGFLDPAFADSANAGQLDILAALTWVKNNIENFGGDPSNVTVFGQSGGGSKITALMVMPGAQDLFNRAINMSGVTSFHMPTAESREALTLEFLKQAQVDQSDLRRLQALPYDQLRGAYEGAVKALTADDYRPVIDGVHIMAGPLTPEGLAVNAAKPLMVGTTETEASLWLGRTASNADLTEEELRARVKAQFDFSDEQVQQLVAGYRTDKPDRSPYELLAAMATDAIFRGRMLQGVEAKANAGGAPVYLYNFAWRIPIDDGIWLTPHATDIAFAFGNMEVANIMTGDDLTADDVSRSLMSAFTAFAKTGDPNNPDMPDWAPYDTARRATMVVKEPCELVDDYLGGDRVASQAIQHQESFKILAGPLMRGLS
jgi:para-nitrobenzyl esterase